MGGTWRGPSMIEEHRKSTAVCSGADVTMGEQISVHEHASEHAGRTSIGRIRIRTAGRPAMMCSDGLADSPTAADGVSAIPINLHLPDT